MLSRHPPEGPVEKQPVLPPFTQEDILALIGWRAEGKEILDWLQPEHFTRPGVGSIDYQILAEAALGFWKEFSSPPGDHLFDIVLQRATVDSRPQWLEVMRGLKDIAPRLNVLYVSTRLQSFLHQADVRTRIYSALQQLQAGHADQADEILSKRKLITEVSPTLRLSSVGILERYLTDRVENRYLCGIPDFDRFYIGPAKKELFLVMASVKKGKSWWLIHIAKQALLSRARVLHITLEMRKEQVLQRYVQSLTGTPKRKLDAIRRTVLKKDEFEVVHSLEFDNLGGKDGLILQSGHLNPVVAQQMKVLDRRLDLRIEEFPMRSLTIGQYESFLDKLERTEGFIPDMVVMDYPDIMAIDIANPRLSIGENFAGVRRVAQQRNHAAVAATQTNRPGAKAKLVTETDAAEDYSKMMTADFALTFTQTQAEKKLGVARTFVATGRDEQDKLLAVISQNYQIGQFCLDSALMPDDWDRLLLPYQDGGDDPHDGKQ